MDALLPLLPCSAWRVTEGRARSQGAFGLPFGLLMVLVCGGELFTGNTALVTVAVRPRCTQSWWCGRVQEPANPHVDKGSALYTQPPVRNKRQRLCQTAPGAFAATSSCVLTGSSACMVTSAHAVQAYEGKATPGQLMKNWLVSYAGNFLGSALVVALVAASGVMASAKAPAAVAVAKTSLTFTQVRACAMPVGFYISELPCTEKSQIASWRHEQQLSVEAVRCANGVACDDEPLIW